MKEDRSYDSKTMFLFLAFASFISLAFRLDSPVKTIQNQEAVSISRVRKNFYVAPDGRPDNNGKKKRPWDLQTALDQPAAVQPGTTIYLRGGTYVGKFISNLTGTASNPITVRSYPGEWAKIDGYVHTSLNGSIGTGTNPITLANASIFSDSTVVFIDNEQIYMADKSGNTYSNIGRGWGGTPVTSHSNGATVRDDSDIFNIDGAYTNFRDFEVMSSYTIRSYNLILFDPSAFRGEGINVHGNHIKLINLVIHDCREGIGFWVDAIDSEIYGCIIYNNGLIDKVRGHGHGIYISNDTGLKKVSDVVSFNNFSSGMKAYSESAHANNVYFEGVSSFNNGSPDAFPGNPNGYGTNYRVANMYVGTGNSSNPTNNIHLTNNYTYHKAGTVPEEGNVTLGYQAVGATGLVVSGNRFMGGNVSFGLKGFAGAVITGNSFYAYSTDTSGSTNNVVAEVETAPSYSYTWDNNNYSEELPMYSGNAYPFMFNNATGGDGGGTLRYDEAPTQWGRGWRQWTGFDGHSQYRHGRPTGVEVFVRPNQYEPGRAHITVYNWSKSNAVKVNVSNILQVGMGYEVRNVQNYFGKPVLTGVYDGRPLRLPMNDLTVATPIGLDFTPLSTAPEFNVFVLMPTQNKND